MTSLSSYRWPRPKAAPDGQAGAYRGPSSSSITPAGGPDSIQKLLADLKDSDPRFADVVLASMAKGWPRAKKVDNLETVEKRPVGSVAQAEQHRQGTSSQVSHCVGQSNV